MNRNIIFQLILFTYLLLLIPVSIYGTDINYSFKKISFEEGLSNYHVTAIAKDQEGSLWVGTSNGLNRIIGESITQYMSKGKDRVLPSNQILDIFCDRKGSIWVFTPKGAVIYNAENNTFITPLCNGIHIEINSFHSNSQGIFFGGNGIIYFYSYKTGNIRKCIEFKNEFKIRSIVSVDDTKFILRNDKKQIFLYDKGTNQFKFLSYIKSSNSIFLGSNNKVWIAGKRLLYQYSIDKTSNKWFSYERSIDTGNSIIKGSNILNIYERNNQLFLATDGSGIISYDEKRQSFNQYFKDNDEIISNVINTHCILQDNDIWWIGSIRGGLYKIKRSFIRSYKHLPYNTQKSLSNSIVSCLIEAGHKIWVATDGGGINSIDPQTDDVVQYSSTRNKKVISMSSFSDDELLLYVYEEGFFLFNIHTYELIPFNVGSIIQPNGRFEVFHIDKNTLGFLSNKLYLYDIEKKKASGLSIYSTQTGNKPLFPVRSANSEELYIHNNSSIFKIEQNNRQGIKNIYKCKKDFHAITTDAYGNFWVYDDDGLKELNLKTDSAELKINMKEDINAIICDKNNCIWMGSRFGIFSYNIKTKKIFLFNESDGVYPNMFMERSVLVSKSNDVYLGGINGLVKIQHDIKHTNTCFSEIYLTSLLLNDINCLVNKGGQTELEANYDFNSIKLNVSIKEQEPLSRKRIFYYIENDGNIKAIDSFDNYLTINNLLPGNYHVKVSYIANDGKVTKPITLLKVKILPPLWKRDWMMILYFVCVILIYFYIYKLTFKRKKRRLAITLQKDKEKLAEDKIQYLINISHELRTPLTLIYSPLKSLLKNPDLPDDINETLHSIYMQSMNMTRLINMVLTVNKMEVKGEDLIYREIELNDMILSIKDEFSDEFRRNRLSIRCEFEPTINVINADNEKLRIILSNLLMNALKYSEPDSNVIIKTEVAEPDSVRISVIDEGIGISKENADMLFNRFYRNENKQEGYGIGLSYVKMLVEKHGGEIGAFKNEGKGSTFYIILPIAIHTMIASSITNDTLFEDNIHENNDGINEESTINNIDTSNYSILLVDDNKDIINLLQNSYKSYFNKIYSACNGEKALQLIHDKLPDIVISDVMMPIMDGHELCKRLKSDIEISHIPIILLTAKTDTNSIELGYKLGADNYIEKPFDIDLLFTIIKNELKKRELIKQKYKTSQNILSRDMAFSNADECFIDKLNSFIESNMHDPNLSLNMILEYLKMNKSLFQKKINSLFDLSLTSGNIKNYINQIRIERAKQMLAEGTLNISEVAYQVGFSSPTYFSTVFKQFENITPREYIQNKTKIEE